MFVMKKLHIIYIFALVVLAFTACTDDRDDNPTYKDPTTFVLNTPAYASTVYDLKYASTVELTCTQPDYGYTTATTYTVQLSLTNNFTDEGAFETLETTYTTARMNVDAIQFSKAIINLWGNSSDEDFPTTPLEVFIRLRAHVTNNGMGEIYSNVISLEKVLGNPETPITLDNLYVVGSFSGWNWANSFVMPPVNGSPGMFWGIMYFDSGDEFMINVSPASDGNEGGYNADLFSEESIALADLSDSNGNIRVGKSGWYMIVVNSTLRGREMTYNSIEFLEPIVYLNGVVAGGWNVFDEDSQFSIPTTRDGEFVSPAFAESGELRICVLVLDDPGDNWWKSEFVILNGAIAYRGDGPDQERVNVNAGARAYLNFMDGTGSVK